MCSAIDTVFGELKDWLWIHHPSSANAAGYFNSISSNIGDARLLWAWCVVLNYVELICLLSETVLLGAESRKQFSKAVHTCAFLLARGTSRLRSFEELEGTEVQDNTDTQSGRHSCMLHGPHRLLCLQKKASLGRMEKWNNYFMLQQWARTVLFSPRPFEIRKKETEPPTFINVWETWGNVCNCIRALGNNNFKVHATKVSSFLSYIFAISFFNYSNCKCVFVLSSQQN